MEPRHSHERSGRKGLLPPLPPSPTSSLTLAELSLQRGDIDHSRAILERRIGQGASDFKTLNLYGISLVHARCYDNAATIFTRLRETRLSPSHRAKAAFNLGLTLFYHDLDLIGDLSVSSHTAPAPAPLPIQPAAYSNPFARAVDTWEHLLAARTDYADILETYLSFAYLQQGKLSPALDRLIDALDQNEGFFVSHYVLGRVFLDLFYLAVAGTHFGLSSSQIAFFDIEHDEIIEVRGNSHLVAPESLLDICLQSFLEGRDLNPLSVEIMLGLCRAYLLGGLYEEAHLMLEQAESLAPESPTVLESALLFYEHVQSPPDRIRMLVTRIQSLKRRTPGREAHLLIAPYFLF